MSFPFRNPTLSYEDEDSSDSSDDSSPSQPKTFVASSSAKQPKTFKADKTPAKPKPSLLERAGSVVKGVTESLTKPLPEHKPADLPSESEVESAARAFEEKTPEKPSQPKVSKSPYNVQLEGRNLLLPSTDDAGRELTPVEAIAQYRFDGKHLGEFNTPEDATRHARILSQQEEPVETPSGTQPSSQIVPPLKPAEQNPELARITGGTAPDELSRVSQSSAYGKEILQRLLTGTSPELEQRYREAGITGQVQGPELQQIPGVSRFFDDLAQKITGSEGNLRLGAGAVVKALGGILATVDPRAVALREDYPQPPIKQAGYGSTIPPRRPISGLLPQEAGPSSQEIAEDAALSVKRAQELPPDLVAPGEEDIYNTVKEAGSSIGKSTSDKIFDLASKKFGMSEGLRGERVSEGATPKTFVPHKTGERAKPNFVNPFEKVIEQTELAKPETFQPEEGRIGPHSRMSNTDLVEAVANGQKRAAILENVPEKWYYTHVQGVNDRGLDAMAHPNDPNSIIIAKNPADSEKLAVALKNEDHAAVGKLLGYSDADVNKFMENMGHTEGPQFQKNKPLTGKMVRDTDYAKLWNNPDEKSYSDALDRHISSIQKETDPEVIQDNYNNWQEEYERAKVRGNSDDLETAGTLRDEALDRLRTLEKNKPQFARSEKGGIKIGQNIKRAAKELTTGYSQPLEAIMMREGMQNAIDAVRHLDLGGQISSHVDYKDGIITIGDNGKGMNRQQLETVFSDLNESGKATEAGATGGKGVGKASYMLGGKHFKAETVVFENGKKIKRTIEGTPDEFSEHVPIKEEVVPLQTPTGTKIQTQLEKGQNHYYASKMLKDIKQYSRGMNSKLTTKLYAQEDKEGFNTGKDDELIGRANLLGNDVDVIVPKDENNPLDTRSFVEIKILNNGMYQFNISHYLGEDVDHMPRDVIVNIKPKAEEGTVEYPFPTSRDALKDNIRKEVTEMVNDRLVNPEKVGKKNRLKELYESMTTFQGIGTARRPVLYDPGNRLTKQELNFITNSNVVKNMMSIFDGLINNILQKVENEKWADRLEGVGIVLDPNMHGVHIPNPTTGKSTILINPFEHIASKPPEQAALENTITALHEVGHIGVETPHGIEKPISGEEIKDPRIGKYLQSYLEQVMTHGGLDQGHGVGFIKRLGEVYSSFGPRRTFDAADQLEETYSGQEPGSYNSEVQRLLQVYQESRGRQATTEDLLSGTGDKQKSSGGGKGDVPGGDKTDGDRTLRSAIDKLFSAVSEAKGKVEEQASLYKSQRAQRFAEFGKVKEEGAAGAAKSLGKLRGEYEKVEPQSPITEEMSEGEVDSLFTAVKRAKITDGEKARGYTALFKLLNGEENPQRSELAILDAVFGNGFASRIVEMQGGIGGVGIKLAKVANTMKSLQNAISLAAPLRHGAGMLYRKEFYPAFVEMFKYFGNKEYYNAAMQALESRPTYLLGRESGLFLSKPGSLLNSEEEFLNSYVGSLPRITGIPMAVGASQRAYTGFLNKLRADVFDNMIKTARSLGNEPFTKVGDSVQPAKSTRAIARFINTATGRGDLGALNKINNELNMLLWSPRMIKSRIDMLANPKIYTDLPKGMRLEGLKSLLGIAAMGTIISGLAAAAGAKISTNILSSDFLKSRFGNKVVDPLAGFQQQIVAAARFLAGKTDSKQPTNRAKIAWNFAQKKLSPAASLADSILEAKKFTGGGDYIDEYNNKTSVQSEVGKRFLPIFVQDINDLAKTSPDFSENIGLNTALAGASLAGMSQEYPERKANTGGIRKLGVQKLRP